MTKPSDEDEHDTDIFSAQSYGFKNTTMAIGIIILVCAIAGLSFQYYKYKTNKVSPPENKPEQFQPIEQLVDEFKSTFEEKIEEMEQKHANERMRLATLKKSYDKRAGLIGEDAVENQLLISKQQAERRKFVEERVRAGDSYKQLAHLIEMRRGANKWKVAAEQNKPKMLRPDSTLHC